MSETLSDGVAMEQIGRTEDTDDPVFKAVSDVAQMTFIFPSEGDRDMIIHTVESEVPGGMSEMLDSVCGAYDCLKLRFSTPVNDTLEQKLHGFEMDSEKVDRGPLQNERWVYLDGEWNPEE